MNQLSDPKMLAFILKQMENQLPYFGPFPKLSKNLLKKMLDLWGSATETVRILAFINIRRMALDFPYPFIGSCLKGIYLTYVRNAKFTNPKTLPLINFMSNCVTEIYGLDWNLSYQHMFVYIRQLAIILRTSFNTKSKDSYDTVYNWQFVNSIRAFVRIFSAYPNQPVLQLLLHPLIQIIQGVISLVPTARYFPLRFQCVRMMNEIAMFNTGTYVNGLPFLLEVRQRDCRSFYCPLLTAHLTGFELPRGLQKSEANDAKTNGSRVAVEDCEQNVGHEGVSRHGAQGLHRFDRRLSQHLRLLDFLPRTRRTRHHQPQALLEAM